MFITVKKNYVITFILFLVVLFTCTVGYFITEKADSPRYSYTVVIDAGHGGVDGGVVGFNGNVKESDLVLEYAKCLGEYFNSLEINVVQTRTTKEGLYSSLARNKKQDDMKKRQEIIFKARPDIVISLHMNGYVLSSQRGITAFFNASNESGKVLAMTMQDRFKQTIDHARSEALSGDYFILNCTNFTSVLIECGFLTNEEEEQLLITNEYKEKVCFAIFSATLSYLIENAKFDF